MIDTEFIRYLVNIDTKERLENNSCVNMGEIISHYYDHKSLGIIVGSTLTENKLCSIQVLWSIKPNAESINELLMYETYQCLSTNQDNFLGLDNLEIDEQFQNNLNMIL